MISGIGVDIIEVGRIAAKINKESGFRELLFSKSEIAYCEARVNKFEHYAARFAAKEAFLKALGTGWMSNTSFNEIEVIHNGAGKPYLNFLGVTFATITTHNFSNIQLSLSHIKDTALAFVIIES